MVGLQASAVTCLGRGLTQNGVALWAAIAKMDQKVGVRQVKEVNRKEKQLVDRLQRGGMRRVREREREE